MPLLPTPWPADPVEGEPGHFDHTLWVKAGLIALDNGKIDKPGTGIPSGKLLATVATDTWEAVDPTAVGGVPSGVIVMWSGSIAPAGWALCDGTNGTPDLRNQFVLAWGSRAPGSTGGEPSVTLTAAQSGVPAHTHTTDTQNAPHSHSMTQSDLSHTHQISSVGSHAHGGKWIPYVNDITVGGTGKTAIQGGIGHDAIPFDGGHGHTAENSLGLHSHAILSGNATHSHSVNANAAANASQAHNNMPPYYVLAFIMKV